MNERIRRILNEATVGLEPDLSPQTTVTLNELNKFAELLIRESARIADMVSENKVEWVGGNILNYFGVQE